MSSDEENTQTVKCVSKRKSQKWIEVVLGYRHSNRTLLLLDRDVDDSICFDSDSEDLYSDSSYCEEFGHHDLNYYPSDRSKKLYKQRRTHDAINNFRLGSKRVLPKFKKLSSHRNQTHSKDKTEDITPSNSPPKASTTTSKTPKLKRRRPKQPKPSHVPVQRHALVAENAPSDLDERLVALLIELQNRDILPEDYETLSKLDERLVKRTVRRDLLSRLPTGAVSCKMLEVSPDCMICMDAFTQGTMVKHLPCGHFFHVICIDRWLGESSQKCPLDNIPIDY